MNYQELNKKLLAEFDQKRKTAEDIASKNRNRVNKFPVFLRLEKLEKQVAFELAKAKDAKEKTIELSNILKSIRAEKIKFLKSLNLTADDLKPKYSCNLCNDTGIFEGSTCVCFKKRKNTELIKACGIDASKLATFEKFDTSSFKNKLQAETLEKFKTKLKIWTEKYPNIKKKNFIFSGTTGVGKSFLTECMASALLKKDYSVCFVSAFEMNNMMLAYHTTFNEDKASHLVPLLESDFLFIDDLGTEPLINNVTINYLFTVISERERLNKPIFVTTNLLPEDILDRYGERIYSRLFNKLTSARFLLTGDDLRV